MQTQQKNERFFSIELNSKQQIKSLSMAEGQKENTLIEGSIGDLIEARFTDDVVLEVIGTKGILRLDLQAKELKANTIDRDGKVKQRKN